MRKEFVNAVAASRGIKRLDLVEKDLVLHRMLTELAADKIFSERFVFKGGTSLIKAYYGYKRFSEDIDFTWKNQDRLAGMSQKRLRSYLSGEIDKTGSLLESIAKSMELDFRCEKGDRRYVELTGSNKICTFKIWYASALSGRSSFIKVQINFIETLCFPCRKKRLKGLVGAEDAKISALFPEAGTYSKAPELLTYDVREILSEKIRAILTRRGNKARDFLDAYFIHKEFGIEPEDVAGCALRKTKAMLKLYSRYRSNLKSKTSLMAKGDIFRWGEERDLLLTEIDEGDFYAFVERFGVFLKRVVKEAA